MNSSWPKWLVASIAKHFHDNLLPNKMYLEGDERGPEEQLDIFELRLTGPDVENRIKNQFILTIEVNLLVKVIKSDDIYKLQKFKGIGLSCFTNIPAFKFGQEPEDDQSEFGCILVSNQIEVTDFGDISVPVDIQHATIEATYTLECEESNG